MSLGTIIIIIVTIILVIAVIIGGRALYRRSQSNPRKDLLAKYEKQVSDIRNALDIHVPPDEDFYVVDNRSSKSNVYIRNLSIDFNKKIIFTAYSVIGPRTDDDPKWEIIPMSEIQDCIIKLGDEELASVRRCIEENEGSNVGGAAAINAAHTLFDNFKEVKTMELLSIMFPRNNPNSAMFVLPVISVKTTDFNSSTTLCEQIFAIMYAIIEDNFKHGYIVPSNDDEDDEDDEDAAEA